MVNHYTGMVKIFESPAGRLELGRLEEEDHPSLQAWDAADEYALGWLAERREAGDPALGRVLVVNDGFGALTVGLADLRPALMTDSFLSARALELNLERNGKASFRPEVFQPGRPAPGGFTFAVVKIPKTLSLLEYEVGLLRELLVPGAVVLGAGMTREIHRSTLEAFGKVFGHVTTSLARKKARLVFARNSGERPGIPAAWPKTVKDAETGLAFALLPGVFSQAGIDGGTRLLLGHFPAGRPERVVDLGCGAGILGLAAAKKYPACKVDLVDESFLAVEAARLGFRLNGLEDRGAFHWGNRLEAFAPGSVDLILCNPPFHERREITLSGARGMFRDAARVLKAGGELVLVTNSHLGYHQVLRTLFSETRVLEKTPSYTVFSCKKAYSAISGSNDAADS